MNPKEISGQALLGKNLKKYRSFLRMTQSQLAERCGVSVNFISEIEGGKAWVSAETLDKLVLALNISHQQLFTDDSTDTVHGTTEAQLEELEKTISEAVLQLRKGYLRNK